MAKEKRNIEFDETIDESGKLLSLRDFIDGNLLTRRFVLKQARFVLLLVLIAFLSIANRNYAEKMRPTRKPMHPVSRPSRFNIPAAIANPIIPATRMMPMIMKT